MNIISLLLKIILEITWGLSIEPAIETILDKLDDMSLLKKVPTKTGSHMFSGQMHCLKLSSTSLQVFQFYILMT